MIIMCFSYYNKCFYTFNTSGKNDNFELDEFG